MFLFIYGKHDDVCEELKSYYNFRATAYYEWDYMNLLDSMVESVGIVLEDNANDELMGRIKSALLRETYEVLAKSSIRQLRKVTARWDELNMHFIGVVKNIPEFVMLDAEPSYKVLLKNKESYPPGRALNDCAVSNNYDQVIETIDKDPKEVAALIGDSLHRKFIPVSSDKAAD
jgi:hypothetical protein